MKDPQKTLDNFELKGIVTWIILILVEFYSLNVSNLALHGYRGVYFSPILFLDSVIPDVFYHLLSPFINSGFCVNLRVLGFVNHNHKNYFFDMMLKIVIDNTL